MLTMKQESEIKEKAQKIKEEKKLRKIYPMVVFGETGDEKEVYVAYMSEPTFPQFSKFMAASKKDEVMAMRTLARDCFIDGDRELVDNDSMVGRRCLRPPNVPQTISFLHGRSRRSAFPLIAMPFSCNPSEGCLSSITQLVLSSKTKNSAL